MAGVVAKSGWLCRAQNYRTLRHGGRDQKCGRRPGGATGQRSMRRLSLDRVGNALDSDSGSGALHSGVDLLTLFLIALGLTMDCFAVSLAEGFSLRELRMRHALLVGVTFGFMHALMPTIGWFAGLGMRPYIHAFDHWIAFVLLTFVGGKMIYESFWRAEQGKRRNTEELMILFALAWATSIDALAVGLSFSFLRLNILLPVVLIGLVAFCVSLFGLYAGKHLGPRFERYAGLAGGLLLIGIGLRVLLEHTWGAS